MLKTNLGVLMAQRGLKISDVYEDTGISKTTLMALNENTGKGVQFDTIDKLCNYFDIGVEDFFVYSPYIIEIKQLEYNKINREYIEEKYYIDDYIENIYKQHEINKPTYYINLYIEINIRNKNIDTSYLLFIDENNLKNNYMEYVIYSDNSILFKIIEKLQPIFKLEFYKTIKEIIKNEIMLNKRNIPKNKVIVILEDETEGNISPFLEINL